MAPPKSILKKPSTSAASRKTPVTNGGRLTAGSSSKPSGSSGKAPASNGSKKPKQSITIAQKRGKKPEGGAMKVKKVSKKEEEEDDDMDGENDDGFGDEEDEEMGTDEEIERAQSKGGKVKPAVKRKRPTTADEFGSALTSLLSESTRPSKSKKTSAATTAVEGEASTSAPSPKPDVPEVKKGKKAKAQPILSLSRAKLPPTATTEKLERQAARAVKREKEEKEDRARVRDVVEGWSHAGAKEGEVIGGLEFEKGLRKTAQRGVIKLFNAILTASRQDDNAADDPASVIAKSAAAAGVKGYGKKDKDNVLGRGGKEELTKEGFLDLVKRGSGR